VLHVGDGLSQSLGGVGWMVESGHGT
jgi:hypothetical protein